MRLGFRRGRVPWVAGPRWRPTGEPRPVAECRIAKTKTTMFSIPTACFRVVEGCKVKTGRSIDHAGPRVPSPFLGALGVFAAGVAVLAFGGAGAREHFVHFADDLRSGGVGPMMVAVPSGVVPPCDGFDPVWCSPVNTDPVAVGAFAMSVREVSVREFRMFADRTGYRTRAEGRTGPAGGCLEGGVPPEESRWDLTWGEQAWARGEDHAVVCMAYKDAAAYARWLAEETGKPYRLPTEHEWRHGLLANRPEPALAPGELPCAFRRTPNGLRGELRPVGSCGPNPFGLYEMAGGVDEWTECGETAAYPGQCRTPSGRSGCRQGFVLGSMAAWETSAHPRSETPSRPGGAHWVGASGRQARGNSAWPTANEPEPPGWHVDASPPWPWLRCGSTNLDGFRVALSPS